MSASINTFRPAAAPLLREEFARCARFPFAACAFALIVLAFMTPLEYSWYRPTYDESEDEERSEVGAQEGSLERQITLGSLGLFGLASLASMSKARLRIRRKLAWLFLAYLGWCIFTCLWSDSLSMSLRRIIALGCEVMAAIAIAQRASPRQFAWLVFFCTLTWLGLGIVAEVTQGALQPWEAGYRFKGIFHPNIMSASCALLAMSALYLSYGESRSKRLLQVTTGTAIVFLVLTGSRTALGAVVASILSVWLLTAPVLQRRALIGVCGLALAFLAMPAVLGAFDSSSKWVSLGREDNDVGSLSSRIPLWTELLDRYVSERPLAGYGYGAFWTPTHITDVAESQGWCPSYAHSTYIDLLLSIGLIGMLLFVAPMAIAFVRAARLEARHSATGYGFIAMVIACVLADGTLETTFGSTSFMSFFGICAACFALFAASAPLPVANTTLNPALDM